MPNGDVGSIPVPDDGGDDPAELKRQLEALRPENAVMRGPSGL